MFGTTPSVPASRIEPSGTAAEAAWLATAAASRKAAAPRPSTTNRRRPPDARWRPRSAVTGSVISHPSHLGAAPHLLGRPSAGGRPSDWRRGYLLVFDLYRYRLLWIGVGQGSARGHRARLRAGAPRALRGAPRRFGPRAPRAPRALRRQTRQGSASHCPHARRGAPLKARKIAGSAGTVSPGRTRRPWRRPQTRPTRPAGRSMPVLP